MGKKIKILDLGCGRGDETIKIFNRYGNIADIYGIDVSKKNIELAKKKNKQISFTISKGEKIPFRNAFFDKIYSTEVLEHVTDIDKVLSEIERLLKNGGRAIISFPNHESEIKFLKYNKNYMKQIGHRRIIFLNEFIDKINKKFYVAKIQKGNAIEHLFWIYLFKRNYIIINENGDVNKIIPKWLKLIEEILNEEKAGLNSENKLIKFIRKINFLFYPISKILDLIFTSKRIKLILIKK